MKERIFKLKVEELKQLIPSSIGCVASEMITVEGHPVGYMYREEPDSETDSGWRFFSGMEDQDYADDADNFMRYKVNSICNCDPAIMPYLDAPIGSSFERIEGTDAFELLEDDNVLNHEA
jgi:hypothetical protein